MSPADSPPAPADPGRMSCLTVDVEDWFHVLDTPATPKMERWDQLEQIAPRNVERLLELLAEQETVATFFWLGWVAERHGELVRRCAEAGHEIASHGYGHVLAFREGPDRFREDLRRARGILEDLTGGPVRGFRAPGFGITDEAGWAFEVIREIGHDYDASAFPTARGHGGMLQSPAGPYAIDTAHGPLVELPMSVVDAAGRRVCLFSGGYLRISPIPLVRWGIRKLRRAGRPLIILVHPREIDPAHPRLQGLSFKRRFKCYVNLKSTAPKLRWLCGNYEFALMRDLADAVTDRNSEPPEASPHR